MSTSIRITSGDAYLNGGLLGDRRLVITVTNPDASPTDLTGIDLTFMAKRRASDDDSAAVITKETPSDVEIDADPTTGLAYVSILAADTDDLAGRFPWELQATDSAGPVTLAAGNLYITADLIEGA